MGHMLVAKGKLSAADRELVLESQQHSGVRFGEAALALGFVEKSDIEGVLAEQFAAPYYKPGVGQYPHQLVALHQPYGPQMNVLRSVRSQLALRHDWSTAPGLAVVSQHENDGASIFTANLAIAFAQIHESVLLVDANLQRPHQDVLFNLRSKSGTSDVLAGRAGMDAIVRLQDLPSLSILPAGTPAPNPQELLCRPAFERLSRNLAERFSVVLYDVPALDEGDDALVVAAHAGDVLLVVARNTTKLADLVSVRDRLKDFGAQLVGSVLIDS
ncbi:MAG: chain length determinant protein tyrosine kinase EpsG [Herminiimonas sp.]|nr:chain length determinant protein tyrosine kinase EpsG [Herminiimonas sp.]